MRRRPADDPRGQSLVEMALVLPVLALLVIGTLEFGFVFDHHLTLEYATREGARTGAALANGGGPLGCGAGQSPNAALVDPQVIAAVERVLTSPGSEIAMVEVSEIRIYKAGINGQELGPVNRWTYTPNAGPVVDGAPLDFSLQGAEGWPACSRNNLPTADSLGVSLAYTYRYRTVFTGLFGMTQLTMQDRTVMQLNPTDA